MLAPSRGESPPLSPNPNPTACKDLAVGGRFARHNWKRIWLERETPTRRKRGEGVQAPPPAMGGALSGGVLRPQKARGMCCRNEQKSRFFRLHKIESFPFPPKGRGLGACPGAWRAFKDDLLGLLESLPAKPICPWPHLYQQRGILSNYLRVSICPKLFNLKR